MRDYLPDVFAALYQVRSEIPQLRWQYDISKPREIHLILENPNSVRELHQHFSMVFQKLKAMFTALQAAGELPRDLRLHASELPRVPEHTLEFCVGWSDISTSR